MVVPDEASDVLASDAEQAAYFRETLLAERERILDTVIKRPANGSQGSDTAASQARRAEAEIRYIERLIARLESRFGAIWEQNAPQVP